METPQGAVNVPETFGVSVPEPIRSAYSAFAAWVVQVAGVGCGPVLRRIKPAFGSRECQFVKPRHIFWAMCGRFTYKLTWEELVRLYRLTLDQPPRNTQARYNACPTDPIDTIV